MAVPDRAPDHALAPEGAGLRRVTVFEHGRPVVKEMPFVSEGQLKDLTDVVLAMPYDPPEGEEEDLRGKSLAEVMLIKQARNAARSGDVDDVEKLLDRRLGKPLARSESHNINETYDDAVKRIAKQAAIETTADVDDAADILNEL